ncbi:MAG TPA: hypothetical protein VK864_01030 [Longimicrobiales bacterium]|nr:hypothetical protein [Longimicrobiales bacterium]
MSSRVMMLGLVALAACAPKRIHERPILENGARVPSADAAVETARAENERDRAQTVAARDSIAAAALANCLPETCAAISRGELTLGMTESQVLATTRTTESAWTIRDAGNTTVMVPVATSSAPHDVVGELAMLQLRDGRVEAYSYREAQGVRLVSKPSDATITGRANATAEMLLREGDDLVARGELNRALDRYDRAQVLRANDPQIEYRIATVLDKQLRPIEALIRYQLFLHKLELEKIKATGEAYGYLASAIAHARERVIVLEKQAR